MTHIQPLKNDSEWRKISMIRRYVMRLAKFSPAKAAALYQKFCQQPVAISGYPNINVHMERPLHAPHLYKLGLSLIDHITHNPETADFGSARIVAGLMQSQLPHIEKPAQTELLGKLEELHNQRSGFYFDHPIARHLTNDWLIVYKTAKEVETEEQPAALSPAQPARPSASTASSSAAAASSHTPI